MKILKFGGSSIASVERIKNVMEIIVSASKAPQPVRAIVVSAFGNTTDELVEISHSASDGRESYKEDLAALLTRHSQTLNDLVPSASQSAAQMQLKLWGNALEDVLNGVYLVGELSTRCLDFVMSFGELFSAFTLSKALAHKLDAVEFLDARELVKTNSHFGNASVDLTVTTKNISAYFAEHTAIQIVTGFIASTSTNDTITLGRGGSDYSAALFAAAIKATGIEIWTDVDGLMTADPRKVPKAFSQPQVSYSEAMELSHFGAKVIYPPTMQPALDQKIPILIKNTLNPEFPGTIVAAEANPAMTTITGISSIDAISLLRVQGSGMVGVAGVSSRLFGALAANAISVIMITQASSEHTICFAVNPEFADSAAKCLHEEFELELATNMIDEVIVEHELSVVSVVGENMRHLPGVASSVFGALGKNGVNIVAIAQGSSELNISCVVNKSDEEKALRALHDEFFFPNKKAIHIFLVGPGLIGNALLQQIEAHSQQLLEEHEHELLLVGLCNSSKMAFDLDGISIENYKATLEAGEDYSRLEEFVQRMKTLNLPNSVFVDCTASEHVTSSYQDVLRASISVVTPNKKAQSSAYSLFADLRRSSAKRGVNFLYETSVGAGLPVISTLNDLLKSGDEIIKIEAVLSGTLSYIFNTFDENNSFSSVVKVARDAGLTEPDPRDDLNGLDVARKILILARNLGATLEIEDVHVENLVPDDCQSASSVEEFLEKLPEGDGLFEKRRAAAATHGARLCYIASYENGKAKVALEEVGIEHPFYNLSESDNIISFTTRRYNSRPLVVKGPGAGAEVTAAGVFADIIRIAN